MESADVAIIGAGAAGLMAGIWAGRTSPHHTMLLLDGAQKLGAKILVAGGGRCNVTHAQVEAEDYAGSSRHAIKKVLKRFDVPQTIQFFHEIGVILKQEDAGKLYPITDDAHTVLDGLLGALQQTQVRLKYPRRVERVSKVGDCFQISGTWGDVMATKVILATGGKSIPKSGSDGHGYELAKALGHTITPRVFPALVPLTLPKGHFITALSGVTVWATLTVQSKTGRQSFTNSTLCTHFGLSGPSVLDISRYFIDAALGDPRTTLLVNWLPTKTTEQVDQELVALGKTTLRRYLDGYVPERLARALCNEIGLAVSQRGDQLTRLQRKALAHTLTQMVLPITGNRGYNYAEVTAGGIPLSEIHLNTMESRICPNLYLCGEICDVDGRIGGFNFQWAWASGYVAGAAIFKN